MESLDIHPHSKWYILLSNGMTYLLYWVQTVTAYTDWTIRGHYGIPRHSPS